MLVRIKYLHPNYGKVTQIFNVRDEDELTELIIKLETEKKCFCYKIKVV